MIFHSTNNCILYAQTTADVYNNVIHTYTRFIILLFNDVFALVIDDETEIINDKSKNSVDGDFCIYIHHVVAFIYDS